MKKLLLITGDLAAGKSTFASVLSKRYQIPAFCKDPIKEVLGDTVGFSNRQENLKLSKATMEMMLFLFSQFAGLGKDLILEANFHEKELEQFHKLAEEHEYEVLTLILRGKDEILHERYLKRMRQEGRHPVHLSTSFDVFEDFKQYLDGLRAEEVCGNTLSIDADDFAYQTEETILKQIDTFMQG